MREPMAALVATALVLRATASFAKPPAQIELGCLAD